MAILDATKNYTFSQIFDLNIDAIDLSPELGYNLTRTFLNLPQFSDPLPRMESRTLSGYGSVVTGEAFAVGQGTIRMRLMTPREYARLQGVPDDYPIPSQINQALTGFGDAVCVPVITWIAENVLSTLIKALQENTLAPHR